MYTKNLNHYYNHVVYTVCPFFFSFSIFSTFSFLLLTMNYYSFYYVSMLFSLIFVAIFSTSWVTEIYTESIFKGQYTKKVYGTLLFGFSLFVLTEFLIFFGFFWALFDRYYNISSVTLSNYSHFMYLSEGIGLVKPIQGLFCLYFSGNLCNLAHYFYFYFKSIEYTSICIFLAIILGAIFLNIQYEEFNHLAFKINDHVVNSSFYLLAGFHGFHVSVGLFFLITQYDRFLNFHFSSSSHLGFMLAMIYWHFVDIVWFFLFFVFYIKIYSSINYSNISSFYDFCQNILIKKS